MAKKKNITEKDLVSMYMDDMLLGNETTTSVYSFSKHHNFVESKFYEHFTSFESIEKRVFTLFFDETINLLHSSEDFATYDSRNKLLSFYYTFFEILTANRSYVVLKLNKEKNKLEVVKKLKGLKDRYAEFISELGIEKIDFKNDKANQFQEKSMSEIGWIQLVMTIKFWLDDDSARFEKTDLFIEKSIKASFDLVDNTPVKSVFDFAKFLWKEKMVS